MWAERLVTRPGARESSANGADDIQELWRLAQRLWPMPAPKLVAPPRDTDAAPSSGALVWRVDGRVHAVCELVDGLPQVTLPDVGIVRARADRSVETLVFDADARSRLQGAYRRFALPLLLHAHGAEVLHASAVRGPRGVVAFSADAGVGKSTLAHQLAHHGWGGWADDTLVLGRRRASFQSLALPFAYRVDSALRDPPELPSQNDVPADEGSALAALAALVVLERDPELLAREELRRLDAAEAFRRVFPHAYAFSLQDTARKRRMLHAYLDLVTAVPVYALRFTPDRDRLPHLERRIAEIAS